MTYHYKAKCSRVIDGDTIDCAWIDLGFYMLLKDQRLRLNRINAPESRTKDKEEKKRGLASKKFLHNLLHNKEILIETQKSDAFGRYLAEVWYNDTNVNDLLVENNHAEYKEY